MKKPAKKASPKAASVRVKAAPGVATPGTGGRRASVSRATKETRISAAINLDGTGKYDIKTGIGFLDHMLEQLSRHSLIDITVRAEGDLHIDYHHTTEDTGIVLGECLQKALGDRAGIRRYGSATIPSSGIVSAPATHSRRVKSTSSGLGVSSSDGSSGSSAMPQIGQVPGPSWRICGCIGHVHIAPGVAIGSGFGLSLR